MAEKIEKYLSNKKNTVKIPEVAEAFQQLEQNYTKKLWNQLGVQTEKLVQDENFARIVDLKEFYDNFVFEFEHRINALQLINIVLPVARFIFSKGHLQAFVFLSKFKKSVNKNPEASVRLLTGQIELQLCNKDANGSCIEIDNIRETIEETQQKLESLTYISPVHAAFYKVSASYLREVGNHAEYYREALRYLGCQDPFKLSVQEQREQAKLLGFAALLGKDIYNFGELLAHPVLKTLQDSSEKWLYDFLLAFNSGDLKAFYAFKKNWSHYPDMLQNSELLLTKIRLLCLMEIALSRPARDRHITFTEIAMNAQIELNEVEYLVMKALSNGLIRGSIDQVHQLVNVSWIQPRVLSLHQVNIAADRIVAWHNSVSQIERIVSDDAKEIIVKN